MLAFWNSAGKPIPTGTSPGIGQGDRRLYNLLRTSALPDKDGFKIVARMWEHQALDPHVKRHQLSRKWWA
jgi:hypothetical protein